MARSAAIVVLGAIAIGPASTSTITARSSLDRLSHGRAVVVQEVGRGRIGGTSMARRRLSGGVRARHAAQQAVHQRTQAQELARRCHNLAIAWWRLGVDRAVDVGPGSGDRSAGAVAEYDKHLGIAGAAHATTYGKRLTAKRMAPERYGAMLVDRVAEVVVCSGWSVPSTPSTTGGG
jgi:hypothetical protein